MIGGKNAIALRKIERDGEKRKEGGKEEENTDSSHILFFPYSLS